MLHPLRLMVNLFPQVKSQPRILHLEDTARDAELVRDALESEMACELIHACCREEFETVVRQGELDLVLCDFNLPGYDGLSALRLTKQVQPDVPVIMLSGALTAEDAIECMRADATDYLLKQRPERLVSAVRRALDQVSEQRRRQAAEIALSESEQKQRRILNNINEIVYQLRVTNATPESGDVQFISAKVESILGFKPEDFTQNPALWFQLIHPEDLPHLQQATINFYTQKQPCTREYRMRVKTGEYRWMEDRVTPELDEEGNLMGIFGVAHDITEHKYAAERIHQQARLIEQATDAIFVVDLDQRVTFWNPGAERLYGFSAHEVLGRTIIENISREPLEKRHSLLRTVLSAGHWLGEMRHKARDDRALIVLARYTLLRDGKGATTGVLAVCQDLTEAKALEQQLLRSQRQETLGVLAGGIAHDLNNALAPILMGADLLKAKYPGAPGIVDLFDASARRAAGMVRQLLTFAKGTQGERCPVPIIHLLREMQGIIQATFPKNITLVLDCAKNLPDVMGDVTQMHQVLLNLSVNARDAMPDGGTLTLEAKQVEISLVLAGMPPNAKTGHYVAISVKDNGTGMSPEIRECIFDPFFTTKAPDKGTGIGLSTVMGIVKGHEGFLEVTSEPGCGTVFTVFMPAEAVSVPPASPPVTKPPFHGRGETILFVDDEEAVREVAREVLQGLNFRVVLASDGLEALMWLNEHPATLSAVITDLHMPNQDGLVFVGMLKRVLPNVPVVVSSGKLDDETQQQFEALGVSCFLNKPFSQKQLMEMLRELFTAAEI
jgi:PAS domain S-box-containing protein